MGIRRIVTGHDNSGKSVFASDMEVGPVTVNALPGIEFYRLWGADQPCNFPDDGSQPACPNYFPPLNGFRFGVFTLAPDSTSMQDEIDMDAVISELNEKLPGFGDSLEADNPGMHTTATIDYEYIVSGRCVIELDNGQTQELGPGDTLIQNGTRHAWRNPYNEACVIVFALVGAQHNKVS